MPLAELRLIERLRQAARRGGALGGGRAGSVITGIGDDCAVLRASSADDLVVTTDLSLEGVHFRRDWHPAELVGRRCLARALSDIAAVGGEPVAAFLSLAAPASLPQSWVEGFTRGFLRLAKRFQVTLAGGDTAESPGGIVADALAVGRVPRGQAVLRSGARAGDFIYVSGRLGGAAAEVQSLMTRRAGRKIARLQPAPRVEAGIFLRQRRLVSAMIDLSDGLSTDLFHICRESGVGAEIEAAAVPVARNASLKLALDGGEDYELLFTAARSKKVPRSIAGVPLSCIGRVTRDARQLVWIKAPDGGRMLLPAGGWQHFAKRSRSGR